MSSATAAALQTGSLLGGRHTAIGETKAQVLVDKQGQKVIFKTFRAGETMPTHDAPVDVLVTVLAGRLVITVEGAAAELEAGDYIVFPAGARHSLHCLHDARILIYR
ncbi:cupin domain-containing protein [Hymenobacter oligotrophus]|uniref:Cupin domain-containing protein n=1 Tax=Hymenobacter oligotrophus TaxID=2319843 RepID=A0A3B7R3X8_9BACT|nr:cupin domain-containing protein [Hymenobacter oligotrophus]AYA36039.1 cupin domain-containing protein [Hymenobacter oligotrophus]